MRVAIYSRKSKFTGKGDSIGNQIQFCKDYATKTLPYRTINFLIYEDEGFSGGNTNRPEFQKLLDDASEKKFDFLICYRIDRISRTVSDFSSTLELLNKNNIKFISVSERFDTSSAMGEAMIYIASVFAQLERRTIAERIRDNMIELAKSGRWLGGTYPLGYKSKSIKYLDENMKERNLVKLTQVPLELKTVKLIYEKYLELKSLSKLESYMMENKIKTKRGANFSKSSLKTILNNTVYVKSSNKVLEYLESIGISVYGEADGKSGILTYNKQKSSFNNKGKSISTPRETEDWIAAVSSQKGIIDDNTWLKAQNLLKKNKMKAPNQGKTHNALLTGILKCHKCKSPMQIQHGHVSKKTGKTTFYYVCSLKKRSRGSLCTCKNAKVQDVDKVVLDFIKSISINKKDLIKHLKLYEKSKDMCSNLNKKHNILNSIKHKEEQIENLVNKLSLDNDVDSILMSKIKSLKNEIAILKKDLENISTSYNKKPKLLNLLLNNNSIIDCLDFFDKKEIIEKLFTKITWNGDNFLISMNFVAF